MLRIFKRQRGQSAMEFAMITIILLGAFISMQIYIKRGIQGRWKAAIDDLGDQYDPLAANSNYRYLLEQSTNTFVMTMNGNGVVYTKREDRTSSVERKQGYLGAGPYNFFK